jgi:hypothetical protein
MLFSSCEKNVGDTPSSKVMFLSILGGKYFEIWNWQEENSVGFIKIVNYFHTE